jgi:arylsulfatase A-like enzyme
VAALGIALVLVVARRCRRYEATAIAALRGRLRVFVALVVAVILALNVVEWGREELTIARLPEPARGAPSVLLVVVDSITPDDLSILGASPLATPTLDRLARAGVLFASAFATSSTAGPTFASILGARSALTLAAALRSRGYQTAAFSADPVGFTSVMEAGRGFIRFDEHADSVAEALSASSYGRVLSRIMLRLGFRQFWGKQLARRDAADVNAHALRWLRGHRTRPFLAVLSYTDPKAPYPSPEHRDLFRRSESPGEAMCRLIAHRYSETGEEIAPEVLAQALVDRRRAVVAVDLEVGRLLAALAAEGLDRNLVVVVVGAHGESVGRSGRFSHGNALHREQIQVPLIVWWPAGAPAGRRVEATVTTAALPATIMEIAGGSGAVRLPGVSLTTLWSTAEPAGERLCARGELEKLPPSGPVFPPYHRTVTSLVCGEWHYIVHQRYEEEFVRVADGAHGVRWQRLIHPANAEELYDWRRDGDERQDLARTAVAKSLLPTLRRRIPRGGAGAER